jgi:PHD/YefM family antitoxin component YafN of YafNO toxin-antitoxin module
MINLNNIHPLTDFKRHTTEFREQLKKSGLPAVLTVEGRPELVVQDAAAYQKLLDLLEQAEAIEGIRAGLESMKLGQGQPAEQFFADLRAKLGLPGKSKR